MSENYVLLNADDSGGRLICFLHFRRSSIGNKEPKANIIEQIPE